MLKVAWPPDKVPEPIVAVPSMNVTVPVAADGETVAVKVTKFPYTDGLISDRTTTVVANVFTPKVLENELGPKFPCEAYVAFKIWLPTLGLAIVKVVEPLLSICVIHVPLSTLNDTFPVGVPAVELTVTVTMPSAPYVIGGAVIIVVVAA